MSARSPDVAGPDHSRRRRRLLLFGLLVATAILVVAVVRINTHDPESTAVTQPAASPESDAPVTTTEPPGATTATEPPTTTTEPPTTTTTTEPPTTTTEPVPTTTTTEAPPPTTTTTEPPPPTTTTTTEPPPPPPVAVVTPTGIPVTVLEVLDSGYLVRTPCGHTAEIVDGERIEPVRVVLDPGHGGPIETGAAGPNGLLERDLNLTLGEAVLAQLEERGIAAATTRTADYMVQLGVRVEFADALEPEALVSIHHNGPTWDLIDTPGTEIYIQSLSADEMRPESGRLGGLLYEEITAALSTFEGVQWSGLPDAGVKRVLLPDGTDTYALIRRPKTPSVLVEYGYLTNPSEAELFTTDEYIDAAAAATAKAIEAYLDTDRPGSGFIEEPRTFDPGGFDIECTDPPLELEPTSDDESAEPDPEGEVDAAGEDGDGEDEGDGDGGDDTDAAGEDAGGDDTGFRLPPE